MREAIFKLSFQKAVELEQPKLSLNYVFRYLADAETPGRILNDQGVKAFMPFLEGPGVIVELGAGGDYYRQFTNLQQKYEITNLGGQCDKIVDMCNMPFEDGTVDAFVSIFALEHVYDFQTAINECYRCLKPKGRLLLAVPFLYYFHAAPDDYFRFTSSAMKKILSQFQSIKEFSFGNRGLLTAELYHEKLVMGSTKSAISRAVLRGLCTPLLLASLMGNQNEANYAMTYLYLCEKN